MRERIVDEEIRLIPYYRNDAVSLPWYQDPDVCKQVDNRDEPYDLALLHSMYDYFSANGECYYIHSIRACWWGTYPCAIVPRWPLSSARRIRTGISGGAVFWIC